MPFELGDKVLLLDDERVATILAVLPNPMKGGKFKTLEGAGINLIAGVPKYSVAPQQFTDDNGNFTNEPVYYIQGEQWWAWAVTHELKLEKPKQLGLL